VTVCCTPKTAAAWTGHGDFIERNRKRLELLVLA
jgi:hypothetical protein